MTVMLTARYALKQSLPCKHQSGLSRNQISCRGCSENSPPEIFSNIQFSNIPPELCINHNVLCIGCLEHSPSEMYVTDNVLCLDCLEHSPSEMYVTDNVLCIDFGKFTT